jgi:catechol 2,3-dioxygenase-like lactoylglutathione lyase family enzyme
MKIRQLAMVTVQVRDLDAMLSWYRDVLGLAVGWLEAGEFCTLVTADDGAVLALATDHPDRIARQSGFGWTPTLAVDDLDSTIAHLHAQGLELEGDEEGADEGYRLIRVCDPEGNAIGFTPTTAVAT